MNKIFILIFSSLFMLMTIATVAQESGDAIFDNNVLHEVNIQFEEANYWQILTNNFEQTGQGEKVDYLMGNVTIDGELVDSVGVRFKGFTSYSPGAEKQPIKLDFNEFVKGKKYDGLRKLNLNNGTGDPSLQRDVVCYDLHRSMGVKASRTSFAKVYFNDDYWGLYQLIEQVDKGFLKRNFGSANGNLFKNKGWSHFEWLGNDKNPYKEIFELKTNRSDDDWSGFVNLMDVLNNSSDTEFKEEIEKIFNVDLFLKTLAVDVATNNWDSYLEHGRNWYIYQDSSTNIFHWIPWDYNFALGGGLGGGGGPADSTECIIFPEFAAWTNGTNSVQFLDVSFSFSEIDYLWDFADGTTSTEKSPTHLYDTSGIYDVCLTLTRDADCSETICHTFDTSYAYDSCTVVQDGSFSSEVNVAFILTLSFFPNCCDQWGGECADFYDLFSGNGGGGGFSSSFPIDQSENEGVLIKRLLAVEDFNQRYYNYFCDLTTNHFTKEKYTELIDFNVNLIQDAVETAPNSLYTFEQFLEDAGDMGLKQYITDRIDSLASDVARTIIDCPDFGIPIPMGNITINELMASGDSIGNIADAAGEYDDWIELYNNTNEVVDLSGKYLSDSKTDLKKWQIPAGTKMNPSSYLIIWADKDEGQSGLHTNFKLSKSGDELKLSNDDGTIIDSLTFGQQETNISLARNPNGTGDFVNQDPTFGVKNEWTSAVDEENLIAFDIYPNPVDRMLSISIPNQKLTTYRGSITSSTGIIVQYFSVSGGESLVDVSLLPTGLYLMSIVDSRGVLSTRKFIKIR